MNNPGLITLENESISIIRDTYSSSENPVLLYSVGKDSSVLTHLFKKAFYPLKVPVKLLHVDTTWKFKEMIKFRDDYALKNNLDLIVYKNQDAIKKDINPFNNKNYTDIMKTETLKKALDEYGFDMIYGGARRDEEASRSKERVLSVRDKYHSWDPRNQRVEPWLIFNTEKIIDQTFRVFPISNWTELNVWEYIKQESIDIVPLYFAKNRKVIVRDDEIYLYDDKRFEIKNTDEIKNLQVRFRTLGCYPLTAGIESDSDNLDKIIQELNETSYSERSGRAIDKDRIGSMEIKKKEGYF
jgi:sulfate adenylyltransferase subunit 2